MFRLLVSWKIHPDLNIELLEQYKGTNPNTQIIEVEADHEQWILESIIASGPSDDNRKQPVFLVKWKDFL